MHKLEIDSVQLQFDLRKILSDVYIKCETGKITGLLGRNGEGKSCLMNIVNGSLEPQSKSIRFDNVFVPLPFKRPDLLLYLPQFNFIPEHLSLKRIFNDFEIDFTSFEKHFPDIGAKYKSPIKLLSGGHRRIIEIVVIIRSKTQFVLLDEPFSHIMPLHVEKIKEILTEEKHNKGILLTDHMYRHITAISDNLYLLVNGKTHLTKDLSDIERLGYARL
ncbi:MAG: ATP-binding cassette domain-containing protein [Bacteroidota bacterium]